MVDELTEEQMWKIWRLDALYQQLNYESTQANMFYLGFDEALPVQAIDATIPLCDQLSTFESEKMTIVSAMPGKTYQVKKAETDEHISQLRPHVENM